MTRLQRVPLHCFLLGLYFPLWFLSANLGLFSPWSAGRALLLNVVLAVSALVILRLIYRSWLSAGLACSLLIVALFAIAPTDSEVRDLGLSQSVLGSRLISAMLLCGVFVAGAFWIGTLRAALGPITASLNIATSVMLILPIAAIAGSPAPQRESPALSLYSGTPPHRPSIYHVVLDGYSRDDVLLDVYGFDNADFLSELRRLGFFVAEGATSPYTQTLLSMNAVFSANYIDGILETGTGDGQALRRRLASRLDSSRVRRTLDALGYRSVAVETDYEPLNLESAEHFAVETETRFPTLYERSLYEQTPVMGWYDLISSAAYGAAPNAAAVRRALDPVALPDGEGPIFFYNHVIAPHPPFGIDRFGNARQAESAGLSDGSHLIQGDDAGREAYRIGYLEKLRYVNSRLLGYLRHLITEIPGEKVIILHGDHGGGMWLDQERADRSCLWERFSPLLAVYSSDGRLQRAATDDLNLVNIYRLVFASQFGAELPLLESRRFYTSWSEPELPQEIPAAVLRRNCPSVRPPALP